MLRKILAADSCQIRIKYTAGSLQAARRLLRRAFVPIRGKIRKIGIQENEAFLFRLGQF
jgi:hypothetical protein